MKNFILRATNFFKGLATTTYTNDDIEDDNIRELHEKLEALLKEYPQCICIVFKKDEKIGDIIRKLHR